MTVRHPVPTGREVTWAIRADLQLAHGALVEGFAGHLALVPRLWTLTRIGAPLYDPDPERWVLTRARRRMDPRGLESISVEEVLRAVFVQDARTGLRECRPFPLPPVPIVEPEPRKTA